MFKDLVVPEEVLLAFLEDSALWAFKDTVGWVHQLEWLLALGEEEVRLLAPFADDVEA